MNCSSVGLVLGLALNAVFLNGSHASPPPPGKQLTEKQSLPTLAEALKAKRDVWGEAAMRQPEGASYEFFANLLPPLRYVNAQFRYYPIVLGAPFSIVKSRLVSNGSAINARAKLRSWREIGFPVTFHVGKEEASFGEDLRHLKGPRYEHGYLPIVQLGYLYGGVNYEQESFAGVDAPFAESAAVFVRCSTTRVAAGVVAARLGVDTELTATDGRVRDQRGNTLVWFDRNWQWDGSRKALTASLAARGSATLVVFSKPVSSPLPALSETLYREQRRKCTAAWERILNRGIRLDLPEAVVNDAWRTLLVGNFMLAKGDVLCYSSGNQYERQYEAEVGDQVLSLLLFGFAQEARRMIVPLLDYRQAGLEFHNAAFKLQMLAQYFWLTRDAEFITQQRKRWELEVRRLVDRREARTGLLPREKYCGDIGTQVYSLNSNANGWRGLHDMAAVLEEIGVHDEARQLEQAAQEFRKAILAAVEKSERRDIQPPFIPIALFGDEKPYEALTDTMVGSYWCLMAPYVLGSGVFGIGSERERWVVDYLQERGGVCMGMVRFDQHSRLFANEKGLDDLYSLRYVLTLLRRDDVERALVSFYGKLAQGLTRDTFIGAEGTSLVPLDDFGRPMYLPPSGTGNALSLWTLRCLLVQDWDLDEDGKPDTLRLLFATPRRWLREGATLSAERVPTAFGEVSIKAQSRLRRGEVLVEVELPPRPPKHALLRIRLPHGWQAVAAKAGRLNVPFSVDSTLDLSQLRGHVTVRVRVRRSRSR